MKTRKFNLVLTMMIVFLFVACKSSTEAENKRGNSNRHQGEHPSVEQLLVEMDVNKDGKLSKSEIKGPLKNEFSKVDTNDDGYISKEELENAPKPERQVRQQEPSRN